MASIQQLIVKWEAQKISLTTKAGYRSVSVRRLDDCINYLKQHQKEAMTYANNEKHTSN